MPTYMYKCRDCGHRFEEVRVSTTTRSRSARLRRPGAARDRQRGRDVQGLGLLPHGLPLHEVRRAERAEEVGEQYVVVGEPPKKDNPAPQVNGRFVHKHVACALGRRARPDLILASQVWSSHRGPSTAVGSGCAARWPSFSSVWAHCCCGAANTRRSRRCRRWWPQQTLRSATSWGPMTSSGGLARGIASTSGRRGPGDDRRATRGKRSGPAAIDGSAGDRASLLATAGADSRGGLLPADPLSASGLVRPGTGSTSSAAGVRCWCPEHRY